MLSFSELSDDELDHVLRASSHLLKEGGRLVVADEVPPTEWWRRAAARLVRWPLAIVTFLLTQNTTHALRAFEDRLKRAGFRTVCREQYLLGTLALFVMRSEAKATCGCVRTCEAKAG